MAKPTLYALHGRSARLSPTSGDHINELKTLYTLSAHFDVYYNNESYREDVEGLGDADHLGPTRAYDYYYIRNNLDVFTSVKGKRLGFAYPYQKEVFEQSDALVVLTENWKQHLLGQGTDSERKLRFVYEGVTPKIDVPVINVGQMVSNAFLNSEPEAQDVFDIRAMTTGAKSIFGYYGNLSRDLYPFHAFAAIEKFNEQQGDTLDPIIALAGRFRANSHIQYRNSVHLGTLPQNKMPALHSLTLANLTNESPLNHCLGNQKVIESMSLGVPMMCQRLDTFVEQLGADYPCLYEDEAEAYDIVERLVTDTDFLKNARALVLERSHKFRPEQIRKQFTSQPELRNMS